jgi:Rad3-related DNA helicase
MLNFVNIIPNGMVVFFPSYAFLNIVRDSWQRSGLMEQLKAKKKVRYSARSAPVAVTDTSLDFLRASGC